MYRPKYTQNNNTEMTEQLIQDFSLGLMISASNERIESSYLPFVILKQAQQTFLISHLARANPQWKNIKSEVVIHFLGPHRYISPTFEITKQNVPTWNYAAVEVHGSVELIHDSQGLRDHLNESVHFFERKNDTNWSYDLPEKMKQNLEKAIVGLKIKINHIESKFKLSQNQKTEDFNATLKHLSNSSSTKDKEMHDWMLKASAAVKN